MEKMELVGLRRRRGQAPRRDLRRHAQARRPGPRAGARPRDHPVRRARLRPRPGADRVPQPAHRRPQRADRGDVPDRHPRHQHRPHRARQHRPALPPAPGDVRPARDAAVQPRSRSSGSSSTRSGSARSACPRRRTPTSSPPRRARELPPLPPIPVAARALRRPPAAAPSASPGAWCRENGVTPPPGSFEEPHAGAWRPGCAASDAVGLVVADPRGRPASAPRRRHLSSRSASTSCAALFRRPFQLREFIQQAWFLASVTILPTALVAIPFGAVIALQVGGLIQQFGAQSFTGSAVGARGRPRGRPDRDRAAHRRRRRLGDLRRPRRAQDPRGARRDDGARHRPDPAPGRPARARLHARRGLPQRPGQRRRRLRRLLLQRRPAGRHAGRLPRVLHRAGPAARPLAGRSRRWCSG